MTRATSITQKISSLKPINSAEVEPMKETSKLKQARQAAGLTQKQAEEMIGIPVRTLSNYESGSRTPPPWVERLLIEKYQQITTEEMK